MSLWRRVLGPGVDRGVRTVVDTACGEFPDLRVHEARMTPNPADPQEIGALEYQISVRDYGHTDWITLWKSVRFVRITRMPVINPMMRKRTTEYDDQRDLVRALWMQHIHYACVLADTGPAGHGVLYLMGVQGVGNTLDAARAQAERQHATLVHQLTGTYPQIRYRPLSPEEAGWLLDSQQQFSTVLPIRGIPMPRRDAGYDVAMPLAGTATVGGEFEEGIEELVRGMLGSPGYLLVVLASPVTLDQVTARLSAAADQLSVVASQVHGHRAISAGVGLPMMLSTATGDAHGLGHTDGTSTGATDSLSATHGTTHTATDGVSEASGHSHGTTQTDGAGTTNTVGVNQGDTQTSGNSLGQAQAHGESIQDSQGTSHTTSTGTSDAVSAGTSQSVGHAHQTSHGTTGSQTGTLSEATSTGTTDTSGHSATATVGGSDTRSENWSQGTSQQVGSSTASSHGENSSSSAGVSFIGSANTTDGTSDQTTYQANHGYGTSTNLGGAHGITSSSSESQGASATHGVSASTTHGSSESASAGWTAGTADSDSQQVGTTAGRTHGVTAGQSEATSASLAVGQNASTTASQGWNTSLGHSSGTQQSTADSRTSSLGAQQSSSDQTGQSRTTGVGESDTTGTTIGASRGNSTGNSQSFVRNAQTGGSLSFVPTVSLAAGRITLDAMADQVSKVLTAQVNRLALGQEEGMWLTQGYLLAPDPRTAAAAGGLLASSFWAPGQKAPVPQPFSVAHNLTAEQSEHLIEHARVFSPCAHADLRPQVIEPHFYGTGLLSNEVAVLTTPPRIDVPGIVAAAAMRVPTLVYPRARHGSVYVGHVVDTQRAVVSAERFSLTVDESHNDLLHPLITGSTGRGKTETGLRLAHQWLHTTQTMTVIDPATGLPTPTPLPRGVLALDRKSDWRRLRHCLPPDQAHRFRFFDLSRERPTGFRPSPGVPDPYLRYNLLRIPPGVAPNVFRDAICDTMAKVGSLGARGRGILWQALHALWSQPRPDPARGDSATVYERPELSRLVGMADLAEWVDQHLETIAKKSTTSKELVTGYNVIQNRLQFFKRDVYGAGIYLPDTVDSETLAISDLVGRGDCIVLEAAHLDAQMGAFVLAGIFTAVFAYARDNPGRLTETLVVLEEANDYLPDERDPDVSGVQQTVFDQTISMGRALRLSLMQLVQSPERLSQQAINCAGLVVVHSADSYESKQRVMAKLGKDPRYDHRDLGQFLSEIPTGWAIVKPRPTRDWIDGSPVLVAVDAVDFPRPSDADLGLLA